jgi:hypothetical protein
MNKGDGTLGERVVHTQYLRSGRLYISALFDVLIGNVGSLLGYFIH